MMRRTFQRLQSAAGGSNVPALATPVLPASALCAHRAALVSQLEATKEQLAILDSRRVQVRAQAAAVPQRLALAGGVYLAAQFGILFHWVYVAFDWNLVEPITYLLGYGVVWLSVLKYFLTGKEFSYDVLRETVARRAHARASAAHHYDEAAWEAAQQRRVVIEATIADMDRANVPTA